MFLRDEDLHALITARQVVGVRLDGNPDGPRSPVQPCSLDLTIGHIFVPGSKSSDLGGSAKPRLTHTLGVGETVVVETKEVFHLPSDIGAFGFPPTTISKVGVLVTNLGHIDPGYDGTIKFTLVNMGHKSYSLRAGDNIHTILFFRLEKPVRADYRKRNSQTAGAASSQQMDELLDSLPSDFLDVRKRAEEAAEKAVSDELKNPYRGAVVLLIATVISIGWNLWVTFDRTADLKTKLEDHREAIDQQLAIEATARSP